MKTGKHYFGLLTEEEQRNFKEACDETQRAKNFDELMEMEFTSFYIFISHSIYFYNHNQSSISLTNEFREYWYIIAYSNRDEQPNEKPCVGLVVELMEQSPKQPLATFRLIFIYSVIVFLVMCLLMVIHTASYKQGYKSGYRNGIEKVDSIVNYEELTTESVEAVQKLQLNTMRDDNR